MPVLEEEHEEVSKKSDTVGAICGVLRNTPIDVGELQRCATTEWHIYSYRQFVLVTINFLYIWYKHIIL